MFDIEAPIQRIQILYELTFHTPFHLGTGLRDALIDRTVVRDGEDYLYVPGSTIKGALRMHCEQLARLYVNLKAPRGEELYERIDSPHNTKKALWDLGNQTTLVTRIFGSRQHPGTLFFNDARQNTEEKEQYDNNEINNGKGYYQRLQTDIYTQVRLHHPSQTAAIGGLFTSEFGTKDFSFNGSIIGALEYLPLTINDGEQPPGYSLLLLLAGLHMLERLGGNKSTGKGYCTCRITQLRIAGKAYEEAQWQSWLENLDALSHYTLPVALQKEG